MRLAVLLWKWLLLVFARPGRAQRWRKRAPCYLRRLCSWAGASMAAANSSFAAFVKVLGMLVSYKTPVARGLYLSEDAAHMSPVHGWPVLG